MPLTDIAIRQAKPGDKPYKLADSGGLYLLVNPTGSKYWRHDFRHLGKRKTIALGVYPDTGLAKARERHQAARTLLSDGIDPSQTRKEEKRAAKLEATNTFRAVAEAFLVEYKAAVTEDTYDHAVAWMKNDVFPWLGNLPLTKIDAPAILAVLERIDGRGARDTAHRVRSKISAVFRYGIKHGYCKSDPARDLIGAIPPAIETHFAAITEPAKVGEMLRAFDGFEGTYVVQYALKLAPLVFARPGELRKAQWQEINWDKSEWRYFVTKTKTWHIVPLSRQALAILRDLQPLTGNGTYIFPGARDKERPMSEAAINAALRRMGFDTKQELTGHGFRAMARTILHEELNYEPDVIEHQLAHKVPDTLGTAYNRTKFLKQRQAMMQAWGDYLDKLKFDTKILSLTA